jgi:hypothetical protein
MSGTLTLDQSTDDPTKQRPKPPVQEQPKPSPVLSGATAGMADSIDALNTQLSRDRREANALQPSPPVLQKPPKPETNDNPWAAFGQPAMLIAALGSLFTRRPAINAMNAMAGVLDATQKKDAAVAKQKYDEWKIETENTVKLAQFQEKAYDAALKKMEVDARAGEAEIRTLMIAHHDETMEKIRQQAGMAGVKSALKDRKQQTENLKAQAKAIEPAMQDHVAVAEGLNSDDPQKQAAAIDALRKQLRTDAGGKGSTVTTRQTTDLNDVRLDAAKQDILSGDPQRVERGQRLAENILQLGAGALKTPAPGSTGDQVTKIASAIKAEHPEWGDDKTIPEARRLLKGASTEGGLDDETAHFVARIAAKTGNMGLMTGWSRSEPDKVKLTKAFRQETQQLGMSENQINDMILAFDAQKAEVSSEGRTTGTRAGAIRLADAEAAATFQNVRDAYAKLPRGEFRPFNLLQSLVDSGKNSPQQKQAEAADLGAIATYARALNPTGVGREADIEAAKQILSRTDSVEAHNAVIDQWTNEISKLESAAGNTRAELINGLRAAHNLNPLPAQAPPSPAAAQPPSPASPSATPAPQQAPADQPVKLNAATADDEYERLPSGATFLDPDGNLRKKP